MVLENVGYEQKRRKHLMKLEIRQEARIAVLPWGMSARLALKSLTPEETHG